MVPYYMNRNLPGYPYRIYDIDSQKTFAQSGDASAGRMPEAAVELPDPGMDDMGMDRPPSMDPAPFTASAPSPGGNRTVPSDPFVQSWLRKSRGGSGPLADGPQPGAEPPTKTILAVYNPKGSLASTMRMQASLNLGLSLGMLALLLAGILAITLLYRRTMRLRASEQDFVASISHELRTPIAVIQATSENLTRGVVSDPDRVHRYAEAIYGQIKRLAAMVESILLYSGLQSGASRRPSLAPIDLPALWEEIIHPLQLLAAEKGSQLVLDAAEPRAACSDRLALRIVVENLLMNAIRHASPCRITFSSALQDGTLRLRVEHDGLGIPAREHAKVFEPFVRGERSVREQKPGSGIGLHLVKRVIGLLGGRVVLESPYADSSGSARNGCRFTAFLPYREQCGNE